ncbi:MAG: single-stranded DNA-binding protein [Pseudomonadales bacterium]|jgi:single-stranded DNA-binding protein
MPSNGVLRTEQIGFLAADPELRELSKDPMVQLVVITTDYWTEEGSQTQRQHAEGVRWTLFGRSARALAERMKKGNRIRIVGHPRTRKVEKDGESKYYTSNIVDEWLDLTDRKAANAGGSQPGASNGGQPSSGGEYVGGHGSNPDDYLGDDVPF